MKEIPFLCLLLASLLGACSQQKPAIPSQALTITDSITLPAEFLVSEPSTGSWMKLALVINQSVSRMVLPRLIGKLVSQMIF